jgi:hypothetical protein
MANNPFEISTKHYIAFPNDEYIDACILSFQTAMFPPGPMATVNDPVLNARFLFGGYVNDESGQRLVDQTGAPVVVRKWTNWMRVSNNERARLMQVFDTSKTGFSNLFDILRDFEKDEGKLWKTPFKILLEQDGDYQNIIRIKPGANTKLCDEAFYSDEYVPFKVVKAYGQLRELSQAACKFKGGVKVYTPEEMVDPTDDNAG